MKKLIAVSLIVAGTLAEIGSASALDRVFLGSYPDWSQDAMTNTSH